MWSHSRDSNPTRSPYQGVPRIQRSGRAGNGGRNRTDVTRGMNPSRHPTASPPQPGAQGGSRTRSSGVRNQCAVPTHFSGPCMAPLAGFEPAPLSSTGWHPNHWTTTAYVCNATGAPPYTGAESGRRASSGGGGGNRTHVLLLARQVLPQHELHPQSVFAASFFRGVWYRRWGSNPHALRHRVLNPARLPVPPLRLIWYPW